jgi:hypothetical protein
MKPTFPIFVAFFAISNLGLAQVDQLASSELAPRPSSGYSALERGPHHTVWGRVVWETAPSGELVPHTNSYVELATGLNVQSNSAWIPASEQIEGFPGGAVARHGQHSVLFANNLATAGAIDVQAPDGKEFRSHILGLSYRDLNTGSNVWIAEIKDCQGVIAGTNTVIYPNAFTNIKASVRFTYTLAGIEQDILLEEAPPSPESFGLSSASSVLEVITEFINPPRPGISSDTSPPDPQQPLPDYYLDFGAMKIGRGRAFFLGDKPSSKAVPVSKQWIETDGRYLLIEDVPVPVFQDELNSLPQSPGASLSPRTKASRRLASKKRLLPERRLAKNSDKRMTVAKLDVPSPALVLDYITLSSSATNYTFLASTTYYITGLVNLSGVTTFEGNCVIKFPLSTTASITTTNVVCLTRPYCPVVFTASDDANIGESVGGSSINGFYGKTALDLSSAPSVPVLSNFRFTYLSNALAGANITLQDVQFLKCLTAFASGSTQPTLNNALAVQVGTILANSSADNFTAANMTAHYCTNFFGNTSGTVRLTNCLFSCATNWQCTTTYTNASAFLSSDAGLFQTVGGGAHYLAANSPYHNQGTTNIAASLLADIRTKTTYPPLIYSNATLTNYTTFIPQAQRDTDTPDLGYEYEPIDYAFGGCTGSSNLVFTAGTVCGWFRTSSGWNHAGHGIHLSDGTTATFNGRAEAPCYWVRCCASQEGGTGLWQGGYGPGGITGWTWPTFTNVPVLNMTFTRCSTGGDPTSPLRDDNGYLIANLVNSELYIVTLGTYVSSLSFTNCIFERVSLWTSWSDSGGASTNCAFLMRIGTVRGGNIGLGRSSVHTPKQYPQWLIMDSDFDGTTTNGWSDGANGSSSFTSFNYNGFLSGSPHITPNGANDVLISGSFNWQRSWFGNYYLPSGSGVIDKGSTTANLIGMYHFTTQTNQTKEQNTQLDIGYHYVATDANGNPVDTNGNGIPDYLEDINGNGTVDSGEINWQDGSDLGLNVLITHPIGNLNIPN